MIKHILKFIYFLFTGMFLISCGDEPEITEPLPESGHLELKFNHYVDGKPLITDSMCYVNAAGNPYEINEVMYFISDVTLYHADGSVKMIEDWKDIHYVDIDIPSTLNWEVYDDIPTGTYDSITFVFGIPEEKNESFMFVNPPGR